MNIRYNIADNKKIDYFRFALFATLLIALSVLFIKVGVDMLSSTAEQFQAEKDELRAYKEKIEDINKREVEQRQAIQKIKTRWNKKRRFLNALIDDKLFPYTRKLDKLEELLPAGVFINKVILNTKAKDTVQLGISAISAQKLLEAYKVFLKYQLAIAGEAEKDGLFKANMTIKLKNERE